MYSTAPADWAESVCDINYNWYARNVPQKLGMGISSAGNRKMSRDHPTYNIIRIDQNTEKSYGELRRLAGPWAPVKDHQLTERFIIIIIIQI